MCTLFDIITSIIIKRFISLTLARPFHGKKCRFLFHNLQDQTLLNSLDHLVGRLSQH